MTRLVRFANNATSKLASNLSAVGLTMSVTPGDGAKFPALTAGQFFKATLVKSDGTKEVVKVTARSTDTMTIVRANEAVGGVQTAYAFTVGDKVELRLTATALGDELDRLDAAAFLDVVGKSANYTIVEADVSKLIKTDTTAGNVTITLPQISTLTGSFELQVSKNTGDANTVNVVRSGTDTINGLTSYILSAQYQCVWLVADLATNTWTAIASASASNRVTDLFTGSGTAGPFTLSGDPGSKNNTDVFVGGVYQNKSTYALSGNQLTLGGAVAAGVIVECNWTQPLPIGTPSDGSVTTAKLASVIAPTVSSLNGGQLAGNRNKLINGNFGVNQRVVSGTVTLAANAYGHDYWKAGASGCTYTFATVNNVTTITITAGSLTQIINGKNLFSGTHVLSWVGTAQGRVGAGAYGASGLTASVTGGANTTVEFGTGTLSLAQFEPGTIPTIFEFRLNELQLCQQRYMNLDGCIVLVPGTATANVNIKLLPVQMESTPAVSLVVTAGNGATVLATTKLIAQSGVHSIESAVPTLRLSAEP
jgi:hypothetical protein